MRELVFCSGTMSCTRAATVMNTLDGETPWYSKMDYLTALAANASAFAKDMKRKTYCQGKTTGHTLWNADDAEKVAWQWNAIIARRMMPHGWARMLGSGTASNESLHAELNGWYKNVGGDGVYPQTLALHLEISRFMKLLSHGAAMYTPTLRQVRQEQVLALALAGVQWTDDAWTAWCGHGKVALLPHHKGRTDLKAKIKAQGKASVGKLKTKYSVMKRPSHQKKPSAPRRQVVTTKSRVHLARITPRKRTTFTLERTRLM